MQFYLDQNRILNLAMAGLSLLILMILIIGRSVFEIQTDIDLRVAANLRSLNVEWAKASINGRDVFIKGEAPSITDRDVVYAALDQIIGVRRVHRQATISKDIVEIAPSDEAGAEDIVTAAGLPPFGTQLTLTKNGLLLLSGNAPNASQQSMLNAYIIERWPAETFITSLEPAAESPDRWLTIMARAFDALLLLEEGSLELKDQRLVVRGIVENTTKQSEVKLLLKEQIPDSVGYDLQLATPQAFTLQSNKEKT
ncbi:MAG: hypothetical protein HKM24_05325 [Gammaproteobacteria bacterium]|nr:hypothetical protein [Gammaproteobacteria bacterium]